MAAMTATRPISRRGLLKLSSPVDGPAQEIAEAGISFSKSLDETGGHFRAATRALFPECEPLSIRNYHTFWVRMRPSFRLVCGRTWRAGGWLPATRCREYPREGSTRPGGRESKTRPGQPGGSPRSPLGLREAVVSYLTLRTRIAFGTWTVHPVPPVGEQPPLTGRPLAAAENVRDELDLEPDPVDDPEASRDVSVDERLLVRRRGRVEGRELSERLPENRIPVVVHQRRVGGVTLGHELVDRVADRVRGEERCPWLEPRRQVLLQGIDIRDREGRRPSRGDRDRSAGDQPDRVRNGGAVRELVSLEYVFLVREQLPELLLEARPVLADLDRERNLGPRHLQVHHRLGEDWSVVRDLGALCVEGGHHAVRGDACPPVRGRGRDGGQLAERVDRAV